MLELIKDVNEWTDETTQRPMTQEEYELAMATFKDFYKEFEYVNNTQYSKQNCEQIYNKLKHNASLYGIWQKLDEFIDNGYLDFELICNNSIRIVPTIYDFGGNFRIAEVFDVYISGLDYEYTIDVN